MNDGQGTGTWKDNHESVVDCSSEKPCNFCQANMAATMAKTEKKLFRTAGSGATRDLNDEKYVYDKFQHPRVVKEFAAYMHSKRSMPDGSKRDGDNWWQGFPRAWLLESMHRHYMDVWFHVVGYPSQAEEPLMTALCGLFFNVQALMLEVILDRHVKEVGTTDGNL
jgi:hypothetical protein